MNALIVALLLAGSPISSLIANEYGYNPIPYPPVTQVYKILPTIAYPIVIHTLPPIYTTTTTTTNDPIFFTHTTTNPPVYTTPDAPVYTTTRPYEATTTNPYHTTTTRGGYY